MQAKLVAHPCLIDVDGDDEETVWTFQWPRDISANRYAIQETFIELKQDILWTNFQKAWHGIVVNMPEPLPSLADRLKEEDKEEIEYAEAEMKHNEPTYEDDLDFDSAGQDEANETPTTDLPFEEPEPASTAPADTPKRKRGRPTGTTKQAKQDALELPPGGLTPTETNGKKALPGCVRFGKMASEEFSRLCPVVQSIIDAETFPKETIEGLKNSLDRLALRTAHLLYRGAHDADDPTSINPLIEVTLANTTAAVNAAVRDLGLCPEKAGSWEKFASDMKEVIDLAKHANGLMSQMGAGPTIQDPAPRLKDAEGKVLVP